MQGEVPLAHAVAPLSALQALNLLAALCTWISLSEVQALIPFFPWILAQTSTLKGAF